MKAKLAKLRRDLINPPGGGGGGPGMGFDVARTGVASVGFIGKFLQHNLSDVVDDLTSKASPRSVKVP